MCMTDSSRSGVLLSAFLCSIDSIEVMRGLKFETLDREILGTHVRCGVLPGQGSAPPWNAKDSLPIAIVDRTGKTINIAATDKQTFVRG